MKSVHNTINWIKGTRDFNYYTVLLGFFFIPCVGSTIIMIGLSWKEKKKYLNDGYGACAC